MTPLRFFYRELAILPIEITLDSCAKTIAIHFHKLDNQYLFICKMKCLLITTQIQFQKLATRALTNLEWIDPLALPS